MSWQSDEEVLLRNYLLGALDEAQQVQVEERLLSENGFEEKLSAAQDALIDDYVFDALSHSEREKFEKNFVFDREREHKLRFAQTLEVYVDEHYEQPRVADDDSRHSASWWQNALQFLRSHRALTATSAFGLLLLILISVQVWRSYRPRPSAQREHIERQIAELNRPNQTIPALPSTELTLQPTILRESGGLTRVTLTEESKLLTLKLSLPEARQESYRALVLTVEGNELFAVNGLKSEVDEGVGIVRLKIPAEFLAPDDYQIQLWGMAPNLPAGDAVRYYFRLIKK